MWKQLHDLVRDQERHIGRNSVLLDVRIGMLIAQSDFEGAERAIHALRSLPRQEVFAKGRLAMLIMKRDQDFRGAQVMLTEILQHGLGLETYIRKLRALAAASAGDIRTAREDTDFLKSRLGNHAVHGLEARIKLAQGDLEGAERELAKNSQLSSQDQLLRARIMDARANDAATPFAERERLRQEANKLRVIHRILDEYEVER